MITIQHIYDKRYLVNGKEVKVKDAEILSDNELTTEELVALRDFVKANEKYKVQSTILSV